VKPFGVEVIEIVTGYVRSNILHHGLYAPEGSLYLPIKTDMERLKYDGNQNGMPAGDYARSVVAKILVKRPRNEIWEGRLAWTLRFITQFCPLWFAVSSFLSEL
jgi:1-acylglycerone phosphate reductase